METQSFHFPDLETDRLVLRRWLPEDADFVFQHFCDPLVGQYLYDEDPATTREQTDEILQSMLAQEGRNYNRWMIVSKESQHRLGTCGFHSWNRRSRRVDIGYDLQPSAWGKGIMREAVRAALQFAFDEMHIHRVEAMVALENERSRHLVEILSFQLEGILRDYEYSEGSYRSHYLYSLVEEEWLTGVSSSKNVSTA